MVHERSLQRACPKMTTEISFLFQYNGESDLLESSFTGERSFGLDVIGHSLEVFTCLIGTPDSRYFVEHSVQINTLSQGSVTYLWTSLSTTKRKSSPFDS